MAITTMDGVVAALATAQLRPFIKNFTPQAAGGYTALWLNTVAPGHPGGGVAASSGVAGDVPTSSTAGAIPFTNPAGGVTSYLGGIGAYGNAIGILLVYDRLWQNSGLSPTSLAGQTVQASTPVVPLTRPDALGADVEAWWECQTVMGAGSTAPTIAYTNQAGTGSKTGTLQGLATTSAIGRAYRFNLASGDTGVRSIQTYTNGATMTSGTFSLVLRRRLAAVPVAAAGIGASMDAIGAGLAQIYDSACIEFLFMANAASATTAGGLITIAQG